MSPDDRYQIVCECCGLYETQPTRQGALAGARRCLHHHDEGTTTVDVFDVMAHIGAPQQWAVARDGTVTITKRRAP